jgi:hypothetical protein
VGEASVATAEGDPAIERLVELDVSVGEAKAAVLGWNREALAFPLNDMVVADDVLVQGRTDAFELIGSRVPGGFVFAGSASEAAAIVVDEAAQDPVGRGQIARLDEAKFTAQAIEQLHQWRYDPRPVRGLSAER